MDWVTQLLPLLQSAGVPGLIIAFSLVAWRFFATYTERKGAAAVENAEVAGEMYKRWKQAEKDLRDEREKNMDLQRINFELTKQVAELGNQPIKTKKHE